MSRRFVLVALLLAASGGAIDSVDAATWRRLQSEHFTIEGDVSERQLTEIARRLEQFRKALGQTLPELKLVTPTPMSVAVFDEHRDFRPVMPRFEGDRVSVGSAVLRTSLVDAVALCVESGENAYPSVYSGLSDLLLANSLPRLPVWLERGLAEYYSTFELSADRTRVIVGKPIPQWKFEAIAEADLFPLTEVLAADRRSRLTTVDVDVVRFHAQCWAIVHYLLNGSPARASQLPAFIRRLASGATPDQAFDAAFPGGAEALQREVTAYVRGRRFLAAQYLSDDRIEAGRSYSIDPMTPAEVEASIGRMLAMQERYPEADARFRAALRLDRETGSAYTGLGLVQLLQDHFVESLPDLQRGVELDPENAVAHYLFGIAALRCGGTSACETLHGTRAVARREFARAVELVPEFPDALSFLGFCEMELDLLTDAERHVKSAVSFLPGREDYRLHLAQIYMRRQDFSNATALLGPIAATSSQDLQARARQLLADVAQMRLQQLQRTESAPAPPDAAASPSPPGPATTTPAPPEGPSPLYRTLKTGEQRVEGILEAIECSASSVIVRVRGGSGARGFAARGMDRIEFVTYRDDLSGNVTCGKQRGSMPVLLTWRAPSAGDPRLPAGTEGIVVAIEYLPKDR